MIQVNIASQQHRKDNLQLIINALNNQTVKPDKILVILQGYIIDIVSEVELEVIYYATNEGAIARFWHICKDINLIIDDDFIPSKDYIKTALDGLERNHNAFCSFWGFKTKPSKKYFEGWSDIESWFAVPLDLRCIRVGCGLSIWDERKVKMKEMIQDHINFNDMQVAIYCAKNDIPQICLAHNENIATHLGDDKTQQHAIWKSEQNNKQLLQEFHSRLLSIFES